MVIVISSGHGKYVQGAEGYINEVEEARRIVNEVAGQLEAVFFHDDVSKSQNENLNRIVDFHNSCIRDLDVSIHFNAYETTKKPMGTECLFVTQGTLAETVASKLSAAGHFQNRGPKKREDLFFLNNTNRPAILIEVCFVDSKADVDLYHANFQAICKAIAEVVSGGAQPVPPDLNWRAREMIELLTIDPVTIYQKFDGEYVCFISDLDVCNDGSGPDYDDPHYQSQTAYYNNGKFLNAEIDKYVVIPPQIRAMVPPIVMGCRARLTNLKTDISSDAVTGEIGPDDQTGEAAYCLAKIMNPAITHNSGDEKLIYLYELWPGVEAVVDGKSYELEPAGG